MAATHSHKMAPNDDTTTTNFDWSQAAPAKAPNLGIHPLEASPTTCNGTRWGVVGP